MDAREDYAQIQADHAKPSSRRWALEARLRGGGRPEIQYHHSPAERRRLEAQAADPTITERT